MKKIILSKDVHIYQFEFDDGTGFGLNIGVIYNGDDFILVDTGYEPHLQQLGQEINLERCKNIICSHFHPDHIYGSQVIPKVPIIGSSKYKISLDETMSLLQNPYPISKFVPEIKVEDTLDFTFGDHHLKFISNPGHTMSSMLTVLDDKYLFSGDDILFNNYSENMTPYHFNTDTQLLLGSYKVLKSIKVDYVIPGHGQIIEDNAVFIESVKQREHYLELLKNKIPFDQLKNNGFNCAGYEGFHQNNLSLFHSSK